jgi:hypothetical protein
VAACPEVNGVVSPLYFTVLCHGGGLLSWMLWFYGELIGYGFKNTRL